MVAYPVLKRSSVVKEHEFDDVRYTMALLLAMGKCKGVTLRELTGLLEMDQRDMGGLIDDAACNHSLPFPNAVLICLPALGLKWARSPSPPMSSWSRKRKYLRFWLDSSLLTANGVSRLRYMISLKMAPSIGLRAMTSKVFLCL